MNNADMPAMPIEDTSDYFPGLTKLEYFAGLAMQAIVSADTQMNMTEEQIANYAVTQADKLLERLEQQP